MDAKVQLKKEVPNETQNGLMKALIRLCPSVDWDVNIKVHIYVDVVWEVDGWLLFVLNHLAKCQAYFMLEYSAYASVCHVTHGQCQVSF